ncbi:hypothetical protein J8273_1268 [Carpediemonas membranifera]|uniref:Uncharacterized protein n=1 Tax=Carpediemonas membranifera TaxID=201153 RepID=A0A8J6C0U7_9EUKA|nr:hypothetical protein J8273_1268 [Carpediemonas membranifera]|eukprot:KAG9396936.1 hypothetical protein J8273_1268 [Carpediemonas membranifera]
MPTALYSSFGQTALVRGTQAFVCGYNGFGQLGLSHTAPVRTFAWLPFPVDCIWFHEQFTAFAVTDRGLHYAGSVRAWLRPYLNIHSEESATPFPVTLPWQVRRAFLHYDFDSEFLWVFVRADGSGSYGIFVHNESEYVEWDFPEVVTAVRADSNDRYWLATAFGWYGLGRNTHEELGLVGPEMVTAPMRGDVGDGRVQAG